MTIEPLASRSGDRCGTRRPPLGAAEHEVPKAWRARSSAAGCGKHESGTYVKFTPAGAELFA